MKEDALEIKDLRLRMPAVARAAEKAIERRVKVKERLEEELEWLNEEIADACVAAGVSTLLTKDYRASYIVPTEGRKSLKAELLLKNGVRPEVIAKSTVVGKVGRPYVQVSPRAESRQGKREMEEVA